MVYQGFWVNFGPKVFIHRSKVLLNHAGVVFFHIKILILFNAVDDLWSGSANNTELGIGVATLRKLQQN